jgi:pyruvate-formate lyase-activating enzyme
MGKIVLLISLPEISLIPNLILAPLSLPVLKSSLSKQEIKIECHDLAHYNPKIAEYFDSRTFQKMFDHKILNYINSSFNEEKLSKKIAYAITKSGLKTYVCEHVKKANPILVGLSIPGTPSFSEYFTAEIIKLLCRDIKNLNKDLNIVIGGARAISSKKLRDALMCETSIDYLVQGNGSKSIRKIVKGIIFDNLKPNAVPGLVFRKNGIIKMVKADPPAGHLAVPLWIDQNSIQFYKRTISDIAMESKHIPELANHLKKKFLIAPFQFTQGCLNNCAFCIRAEVKGRISPPEEVIDRLEVAVKEYGIKEFMFLNSEINFSKKYIEKFTRGLINRRLDILWTDSCEFYRLSTETLQMMRDAGCVSLWFGLESASERLMHLINKKFNNAHVVRMLSESHRLGIYNCVSLICGLPYEEKEDVETTIRFIHEHHNVIDAYQLNVFYLQGGPFYTTPDAYGLQLLGFEEQVGTTYSQAFNETKTRKLWKDKKKQMLDSYERIRLETKNIFPELKSNMLLILALYRIFGDDKRTVDQILNKFCTNKKGNFITVHSKLIKGDGKIYLVDTANKHVFLVNECVARCHELRHLNVWSHIQRKLCNDFGKELAIETINELQRLEDCGYFLLSK